MFMAFNMFCITKLLCMNNSMKTTHLRTTYSRVFLFETFLKLYTTDTVKEHVGLGTHNLGQKSPHMNWVKRLHIPLSVHFCDLSVAHKRLLYPRSIQPHLLYYLLLQALICLNSTHNAPSNLGFSLHLFHAA